MEFDFKITRKTQINNLSHFIVTNCNKYMSELDEIIAGCKLLVYITIQSDIKN